MATVEDKVEVRAKARWVRTAPRKAQLVAAEIRGRSVPEARVVLAFMTRAAARDVANVLESAVANAEANHGLYGDDLYVSVADVGAGPTLKRWRARARGRVGRVKKRTCHITIHLAPLDAVVSEPASAEEKPKRARRPRAEAAPAVEPGAGDETASEEAAEPEAEVEAPPETEVEPAAEADVSVEDAPAEAEEKPKRARARKAPAPETAEPEPTTTEEAQAVEEKPKRTRARKPPEPEAASTEEAVEPKPRRSRSRKPAPPAGDEAPGEEGSAGKATPRQSRTRKKAEEAEE
jgi:large subunit ribosomal protein L22